MYKRTTLAPNVFRLHVVSELRKKKDHQTPQTKASGPRDFFKGLLGTVGGPLKTKGTITHLRDFKKQKTFSLRDNEMKVS